MDRWLQPLGISFNLSSALGLSALDYFTVPRGQLTFDAEGIEQPGSIYHSRAAHIPSNSSGITIGRGFDLSQNSKETIRSFLSQSKFDQSYIDLALAAAGLRGGSARQYIQSNSFPEITIQQQYDLFNLCYAAMEQDVLRIGAKPDIVTRYGAIRWEALPQEMLDVVIDLRYRGDYTPKARELIQPFLVAHDTIGFVDAMSDRSFWVMKNGVPPSRFEARIGHLSGIFPVHE